MNRIRFHVNVDPTTWQDMIKWGTDKDVSLTATPVWEFATAELKHYDVLVSCGNMDLALLTKLMWAGK